MLTAWGAGVPMKPIALGIVAISCLAVTGLVVFMVASGVLGVFKGLFGAVERSWWMLAERRGDPTRTCWQPKPHGSYEYGYPRPRDDDDRRVKRCGLPLSHRGRCGRWFTPDLAEKEPEWAKEYCKAQVPVSRHGTLTQVCGRPAGHRGKHGWWLGAGKPLVRRRS